MKVSERLDALRLLRDLNRDLFDAQTTKAQDMGAMPVIQAFTVAAKNLITQVEATLKDPA